MHFFAAHGAGDDLRRPGGVVAPRADMDAHAAAVARREEGGVPAKQPLGRQRLGVVLGGIQHHVDHAVHMPVGGCQRADVHAQAPGDRRPDGGLVQRFAFDGAGGDDFLCQRLQRGLVALREAYAGHAAGQMALGARCACASGSASCAASQRHWGQSGRCQR